MLRRITGGLAALAVAVILLTGCSSDCGDSCDDDNDCGGGLVCYSNQCAPSECRDECMNVGVNICYFNKISCKFIECN